MPKPYSTDLRERAVEAVESGASRREVAEIFKVGVSSVVRWCRSWSDGRRSRACCNDNRLPRAPPFRLADAQQYPLRLGYGRTGHA